MPSQPTLEFETAAQAKGAQIVAGVDEVGRGPWAGPVVACAVHLTGPPPEGLSDSKKLPAKRRRDMAKALKNVAVFGFGAASAQEIDAFNIRQATHLAMRRAVAALPCTPDHLLIDGNDCPSDLPCPAETLIKGDARCASIAAASVLAKIRRDLGMVALAQHFPGYGWERNVGYGTPEHIAALKKLGPTPHHRYSFKPISIYSRQNFD